MKKVFVDTNIFVYANDSRSRRKQEAAIRTITGLMRDSTGVLSSQVLQEYANVALTKLGQNHLVIMRQLALMETLEVVMVTPDVVRRAVEMRHVYGISFWDGCILGAAEKSRCDAVLSEDLNAGQYYAGIRVVNPFLAE